MRGTGWMVWGALGFALVAACSASGGSAEDGDGGSGGAGAVGTGGSAAGGTGGAAAGTATGGSGGSGTGGSGTGGSGTGGNGGTIALDSGPDVDPDAPCSTVTQEADNSVDIIWAVDTSCSMGDEIDKIRTNINDSFVPKIAASNIDWRVIFVADRGTLCIAPPLAAAACADNPPQFWQVDCDVESTNSLQQLMQTYSAITLFNFCRLGAAPWGQRLRPTSTKVFVEVTDDEAEMPFAGDPSTAFDNWALNTAQPVGTFGTAQDRRYVFHSITGMDLTDPTQTCSSATNSAVAPGVEYQQLSDLTGGIKRSICEDDWSDIFDSIASGIVASLSCEFVVPPPASGEPIDQGKVNVTYTHGDGTEESVLQDNNAPCSAGADGWQWSGNKVVLCGDTCDRVKADPQAKIDLAVGCTTVVRPPT